MMAFLRPLSAFLCAVLLLASSSLLSVGNSPASSTTTTTRVPSAGRPSVCLPWPIARIGTGTTTSTARPCGVPPRWRYFTPEFLDTPRPGNRPVVPFVERVARDELCFLPAGPSLDEEARLRAEAHNEAVSTRLSQTRVYSEDMSGGARLEQLELLRDLALASARHVVLRQRHATVRAAFGLAAALGDVAGEGHSGSRSAPPGYAIVPSRGVASPAAPPLASPLPSAGEVDLPPVPAGAPQSPSAGSSDGEDDSDTGSEAASEEDDRDSQRSSALSTASSEGGLVLEGFGLVANVTSVADPRLQRFEPHTRLRLMRLLGDVQEVILPLLSGEDDRHSTSSILALAVERPLRDQLSSVAAVLWPSEVLAVRTSLRLNVPASTRPASRRRLRRYGRRLRLYVRALRSLRRLAGQRVEQERLRRQRWSRRGGAVARSGGVDDSEIGADFASELAAEGFLWLRLRASLASDDYVDLAQMTGLDLPTTTELDECCALSVSSGSVDPLDAALPDDPVDDQEGEDEGSALSEDEEDVEGSPSISTSTRHPLRARGPRDPSSLELWLCSSFAASRGRDLGAALPVSATEI